MEILKGYEATVKFPVPSIATDGTFKVYKEMPEVVYGSGDVDAPSNGLLLVNIPYSAVQHDATIVAETYFEVLGEPYSRKQRINVVTPYLEMHEVKEIHDQGTPKELRDVEAAVRHVINAHTGQSFGFEKNRTYRVRGDGGTALRLPKRIVNLESVGGRKNNATLLNEGWMLKVPFYPAPPLKADNNGYHMHTGGVIHNPNNVRSTMFADGEEFEVTADWGWEEVPDPIREAAKLLVNDYACADSQYRDRYLTSMTAADWRIQFYSGAFRETGNVRADQLLKEFVVRRGWAVI